MSRRKRKKRVRRSSERHLGTGDEARFRLAARVAASLGVLLLLMALLPAQLAPAWNHLLAPRENLSMRLAGVGLIIASALFSSIGHRAGTDGK